MTLNYYWAFYNYRTLYYNRTLNNHRCVVMMMAWCNCYYRSVVVMMTWLCMTNMWTRSIVVTVVMTHLYSVVMTIVMTLC